MNLDIGVFGARGIPSTYSGYETFLTELLPALVRRGHGVTMYCRSGEVPAAAEHRGVRLTHLPAMRGKNYSTLSHGFAAAVAARRAGHDVVLAVNVANALPALINTMTGQPLVLNTDGQEWLRVKWGGLARRVFHTSARLAGACATGLVADSVGMAEVYREDFGATSTVIPYMYLDSIPTHPDLVTRAFGLQTGEFFVTGGRLVPENNIDQVAAAYACSTSPLPLLVLGKANYDSPTEAELRRIASTDARIRVLGHIEDRALFASLLAGARRYVHAHSVGGINPSLVEAMGVGADVLAYDTRFNREALGEDGVYFASFEAELTGLLEAAGSDPTPAWERRKANQLRAETHFAPHDVIAAYESLLQHAAGSRSRASIAVETRWGPSSRYHIA